MEQPTKSRKKLWIALALVAVLAVAAVFAVPIISAIAKYNAADYEAAAPTLKKYAFLQDKYLDSAEKLGDSCFAAEDYEQAIVWYSELGENKAPLNKVYLTLGDQAFADGDTEGAAAWYEKMSEGSAEPLAKLYCAEAAGQLEAGLPAADVLATLDKISGDAAASRDEGLLACAALYLERGSRSDAIALLDSVAAADTAPLWAEINAACIGEAVALLASVNQESRDGEPSAFIPMRSAQEALADCRDSVMATAISMSLDALFERDDKSFVSRMEQLASKAEGDPLAGEAAWALWRCFGHLVSNDNYEYYNSGNGYRPYGILGSMLKAGSIAAQLADPAQLGDPIAAMAALAADGEVRHGEKPLTMDDMPLIHTLDKYGKNAGETPKLLFIRNFSNCTGDFVDYAMDYGIDMDLMALLPAEFWPTSEDDVTHIVSLHYGHNPDGKYQAKNADPFSFFGSTIWAAQETGCVRVYSMPEGSVVYESETVVGPEPPESISTSQKSGYISGGPVSLEAQLKTALEACFPELNA